MPPNWFPDGNCPPLLVLATLLRLASVLVRVGPPTPATAEAPAAATPATPATVLCAPPLMLVGARIEAPVQLAPASLAEVEAG